MKCNITESTYLMVKDFFTCEKREPQNVKGKGMMHMYFVTGKK